MDSEIKRAAIYIRVSTEEQAIHGLSLEVQKDNLSDYAKQHNYKVVDYYIDGGKTARKALSKRLELQRLLDDVRSGKVDIIIFTKLDRWFRSVRDYHKVQEVLEDNGVHWKTINENYDTSTASGRLHINIMLSVAQDEADRTSERIKVVFDNKLKNGEAISGALPIGYKIENKKVVVDDRADIARDIFEFYYLHQSQTQVFKEILKKYDVSLCDKTIYRILHNEIYIGRYRGHDNFCEPLVGEKRFYEIQDILKNRNIKYIPTNRVFLFTGLILCSECEHIMTANAQVRNYKSGRKEYILYMCKQHYSRHICSHNRVIYESAIEKYLLNNIKPEIESFIAGFKIDEVVIQKAGVNKSNIRKKLEKLKELYVNDLIDIDMYKKDFDMYTEILSTIEQPVTKKDIEPLEKFLESDFALIYDSMTREEKRTAWRGILKNIIVAPDNKISVTFL